MLLTSAPEMTSGKGEAGPEKLGAYSSLLGWCFINPADLRDEGDGSNRSVPCLSAPFRIAALWQNLE